MSEYTENLKNEEEDGNFESLHILYYLEIIFFCCGAHQSLTR